MKKLWLTLILTVKFLNKKLSITKNTSKIGFEYEFDLPLAEVLHPCNKLNSLSEGVSEFTLPS